jgi:hypothetical protein
LILTLVKSFFTLDGSSSIGGAGRVFATISWRLVGGVAPNIASLLSFTNRLVSYQVQIWSFFWFLVTLFVWVRFTEKV